jgi:hypothetical protein
MKKNPAKKLGQFSESSSGQFTNITNTYDVFAVYVGGSRGIIRLGIYWGRKLNFKKNYTQKKKKIHFTIVKLKALNQIDSANTYPIESK